MGEETRVVIEWKDVDDPEDGQEEKANDREGGEPV
jgi:hypothetical protein